MTLFRKMILSSVLLVAFVMAAPRALAQAGLTPYTTSNQGSAGTMPPMGGGNGWTAPPGGVVSVPAGGTVYLAFRNDPDDHKRKYFNIQLTSAGNQPFSKLRWKGTKGYRTAGSTSTSRRYLIYGFWGANKTVLKYRFSQQTQWERLQYKNNSSQVLTFTVTASSKCADAQPTSATEFSVFGGTFGAPDAMDGDMRITEVEYYPTNSTVDMDIAPTFIAPPESGEWFAEFTNVDPNGQPRPGGGVRFVTDGPGLIAGDEYDMTLSLSDTSHDVYEVFAFDADAGGYADFLLDMGLLPWSDDVEEYTAGSRLVGNAGWQGWNNNQNWDAPVTNLQAHSGVNSIDVRGTSDAIREFTDADEGRWSFSAWQYIPADFTSGGGGQFDGSYFLLLNTYNDFGPYHWSVQMQFDSNDGMLKVLHGDGENTINVPYDTDRWVRIQTVIDLDHDWTQIYYDDQLITEYTWTGGILGDGGGALDIATVDLFANGSSSIFYDDLILERIEPSGDDAELLDLEILKGTLLDGDLESLRNSDDVSLHTRSQLGFSAFEPNVMEMRVTGLSQIEIPVTLDLLIESRINNPAGSATLSLLDWNTGVMTPLAEYQIGFTEEVFELPGLPAEIFVQQGSGLVVQQVKHVVIATFTAQGFDSYFDHLRIGVKE